MRVDELTIYARDPIEVRAAGGPDLGAELPPGTEVALASALASGEILLSWDGHSVAIEGENARSADRLAQLVGEALPRVTWAATTRPKAGRPKVAVLSAHVFPQELRWEQDTDLGIDEKLVEELRRRRPECRGPPEAAAFLAQEVLLPPAQPGGPPRALLSGAVGRTTPSACTARP